MKKRKSVYVIWSIVMLIAYVLFQNTFFGATFFVLSCMGIVSIIISKKISSSINIDIEPDCEIINVHENISWKLKVSNNSIFPSNKVSVKLKIKNSFFDEEDYCEVSVPVIIKDEEIITASALSEYVGMVTVTLLECTISDYFDLVQNTIVLDKSIDVHIMPLESNVEIKWGVKSKDEDGDGDEKVDLIEAYDIKGVREYIDGESLHRIHWNLSARFDELMIKEYEMEIASRFNVMIDVSKDNIDFINDIIEAMCGTINVFLGMKEEFSVYWYDDGEEQIKEKVIREKADVNMLLDEVYATKIGEKAGLVYYNFNHGIDEYINAVYVTVDRDSVNGNIIGEYNNKVVLMCV